MFRYSNLGVLSIYVSFSLYTHTMVTPQNSANQGEERFSVESWESGVFERLGGGGCGKRLDLWPEEKEADFGFQESFCSELSTILKRPACGSD